MQPLLISLVYILLLPWLHKSILQEILVMKICFVLVVCPTYLCTIIKAQSDFFSCFIVHDLAQCLSAWTLVNAFVLLKISMTSSY